MHTFYCKDWDSLSNESIEKLLKDKHVIIKSTAQAESTTSSTEYNGVIVDFIYFNNDESIKKNYAGISISTYNDDKIEDIAISDDMIINIL